MLIHRVLLQKGGLELKLAMSMAKKKDRMRALGADDAEVGKQGKQCR